MNIVVVHVHCHDCSYEYEGKNGMAIAGIHNNKTGHEVGVDSIYVHIFQRKNINKKE